MQRHDTSLGRHRAGMSAEPGKNESGPPGPSGQYPARLSGTWRKKKHGGGGGSGLHIQKSEAACVIPFRSVISADEVRRDSTFLSIESEFVTKYLEKIGVTPTKATADLMRKLTPINLSTLETQLKPGKGSETEVCITLKPPKQSSSSATINNNSNSTKHYTLENHQTPTSSDVISLGILAALPAEFSKELEHMRLAKEKEDVSSFEDQQGPGDNDTSKVNLFQQASTHHLFPYNLKKNKAKHGIQDGIFRTQASSKQQGRMHAQDQATLTTQQSSEEITEHLVQIFQREFIEGLEDWRSQNTVSLKGSLYVKERAFSSVKTTLLSRSVLKLFKITAIYLREKVINKHNSSVSESRKATEQAERLFFILHEFSRQCKANRKEKIGLCFVLPVLLLSLRCFVEHVTKKLFPTLLTTPEGKEVALSMDNTITTLLDPHSWYSRVSVFQSTRTAMQIMNSYRKSAHQPIRTYFHHTSPLVRAALGNPLRNSSQYRTFIHNSLGGKVQTQADDLNLGVGHRERLLQQSDPTQWIEM